MTPRPSEEAREALRAAREGSPSRDALSPAGETGAPGEPTGSAADVREALRAARERVPGGEVSPSRDGGSAEEPTGAAPPADRTPRPSDAAREALHRALRERRGVAADSSGADAGRLPATSDTAAGGAAGDWPRDAEQARSAPTPSSGEAAGEASPSSVSEDVPTGGEAPDAADVAASASNEEPTDAPRPEGATCGGDASVAATGAADRTSPSAPDGHEEPRAFSRPGDLAREALRAAREERARARAREQVEAAKRPRRDPAPRVPRTTRGDRAADRRAREIREALADAFRMPDTTPPASADAALPADTSSHAPVTERPGTPTSPEATPTADQESAPTSDRASAPAPGRGPAPAPGQGPASTPDQESTPTPHHQPAPTSPSLSPSPSAPRHPRGAHVAAGQVAVAPSSMGAPARDGDHRRTFPPFPPRPSGDGEPFAETWWGRAWVTALEDGALDPARLARGRGYAEQGHVDAITVTPGLVLAYVQGSRPRPYRVQVRLRTFDDEDWDRFLDAAADRPGHIAALLDKEMPQSLADCGVPLLPGPGDLAPRCSCPDSGHPCKHAAALCYQTARLLDADPFVLLLLRGRGERELIDALSRLSAARAARAAQGREPEPLPGIRATDAVSRRGPGLPPLPAPLPPPSHPEQPPVHPASPGGPDPFALDQLATDAAARAHALLTTGRDPVGPLSLWHDAVRLAAARPGSGLTAGSRALYASLARAASRTPGDLARAVAAWRQGGPSGLAVLEEPWDPPAGRFDRARPLLLAADLPAFRPWRNRLTHPRGHVQLRLGRDHLWYAYESEPGQDDWWPRGTPDPDPVGALTGLDTLGDA
ncbi:SWIM zinc finger family protein [Streptomyces albogriseolus]|uniref:SWIM zinc finger family protein n=1 Tax=Streptomyces albogriseolus TaxID=1887 RepID=UPI0036FFF10A